MKKSEAKKLAKTVKAEDLKQMFVNARKGVTKWDEPSRLNKGLSRGTAFNVLVKCVHTKSEIGITNMLVEFGDWLPGYTPQVKQERKRTNPVHQDPIDLKDLKDFCDI